MNLGEAICDLRTWDYRTAGELLASMPRDMRNELNGSQRSALQDALFLAGLTARSSGRQSLYCDASCAYFADALDRTRRTAILPATRSGMLATGRRISSWASASH